MKSLMWAGSAYPESIFLGAAICWVLNGFSGPNYINNVERKCIRITNFLFRCGTFSGKNREREKLYCKNCTAKSLQLPISLWPLNKLLLFYTATAYTVALNSLFHGWSFQPLLLVQRTNQYQLLDTKHCHSISDPEKHSEDKITVLCISPL